MDWVAVFRIYPISLNVEFALRLKMKLLQLRQMFLKSSGFNVVLFGNISYNQILSILYQLD